MVGTEAGWAARPGGRAPPFLGPERLPRSPVTTVHGAEAEVAGADGASAHGSPWAQLPPSVW